MCKEPRLACAFRINFLFRNTLQAGATTKDQKDVLCTQTSSSSDEIKFLSNVFLLRSAIFQDFD